MESNERYYISWPQKRLVAAPNLRVCSDLVKGLSKTGRVGWRPSLLGWRPSQAVWVANTSRLATRNCRTVKLKVIALRLEAIASRLGCHH